MIQKTRFACWTLLGLAVILGLDGSAHATWPPNEAAGTVDYSQSANWPNDPGFAKQWNLWSFVPDTLQAQVDDRTRKLGTGAHFDRAWARTSGDPRVLIAVTDCGVRWDDRDLVNKMYLNAAELPAPACPNNGAGAYDRNGDGRFNVQDYTTVTGHQQPVFSAVCDPRITVDVNGNGLLDAEDLINAFSDGVDDDHNGYIDDISGWDFFHNDNDPKDDTDFGHGTGELGDSGAEANNGIDDAGTCPDCTLVMLRVGDSFVTDANLFAIAATYAVDHGAMVIQEALGTLDNTPLAKAAIDYAYYHNVTVVSSAADENSFHHNYPAANNHTIVNHAIRYDSVQLADARTFFNFNNCTNYGPGLDFSIPGISCSSEATGKAGGLVGLLYSAALKADLAPPSGKSDDLHRLTAEEVRQVLTTTVDNFYDADDALDISKYPTKTGWARRFGYGRPNARTAVDAVMSGRIPTELEVRSPAWFEVIHPERTPKVTIDGRIAFRGQMAPPSGTTYDYVVEWAPGVDPDDNAYKPIDHAEMVSAGFDGPIATWDVSKIRVNNLVPPVGDPNFQPDDPAHVHMATLRVRVTTNSSDPTMNGIRSETRRSIHIVQDSTLLPAFPLHLGASLEASPKVVDLLGDGKREIIQPDSAGKVHAIRADGTELPGWPVIVELIPTLDPQSPIGKSHASSPAFAVNGISSDIHSAMLGAPAVGDVDGDGKPDVVVATMGGRVWAWSAQGSVLPGFPVSVNFDSSKVAIDENHVVSDSFSAAPILADFDKDGKVEILAAAHDGRLYMWKGDGTPQPGFPVLLSDPRQVDDPTAKVPRQVGRIVATPAVGDMNGDGIPDIAVGTNEDYSDSGRLYLVDGRGSAAPGGPFFTGWPISINSIKVLPIIATGMPNSPAMADANHDGVPEIYVAGIDGQVIAYGVNGHAAFQQLDNESANYGLNSDSLNNVSAIISASTSIGDLDNDGSLDAVQPSAGGEVALSFLGGGQRHDFEHHMDAWDIASGKFKSGFPRVVEDWMFLLDPSIADLSGSGKPDVIAASGGYFIHAWDHEGHEAPNFPKFTGGWVIASPAVGDLDGDGKLELAVATRDGTLFAWHTEGRTTGRIDWPSFHHDNGNTGNYGTFLDQGTVNPKMGQPAAGCTMAQTNTGTWGITLLAIGIMLALSRRRRT